MMTDKFAIPKTDDGLVDAKAIAKNAVSLVPTILMVAVILAASFVSTLFQFSFSLQTVVWKEALIMIALRIVLQVSSKYAAGDTRVRRGLVRDPVVTNKAKFAELSEKLDAKEFFAWVDAYNLRLKKKCYEDKISAKITALRNRLASAKSRAARHGKTVTPRILELEKRLAQAETEATPEYIEQNIVTLHVKVKPLRASDFLSGETETDDSHVYLVNPRKDFTGRVARGVPFALLFSFLCTLLGYSFTIGKIHLMTLVFDLLSLGINLSMGALFTGDSTLAAVNASYVNRHTILRLYFSEKAAHTTAEQ